MKKACKNDGPLNTLNSGHKASTTMRYIGTHYTQKNIDPLLDTYTLVDQAWHCGIDTNTGRYNHWAGMAFTDASVGSADSKYCPSGTIFAVW